ncbi:respiratory nitrate reductase subunit gamma [Thiocapsa roseopersicina]|uniref:Respiratory nitrate reductase, gamma subunit n=1 Tax=Thiocapsa roseopersicina TaxID=1058 RepID=A0A1H2VM18_THIRO|nr:respiratory nitrate reductase subunit gamma [Thiocapsa roseopersicina]SDW69327.1 respiratory nitrate reductase, gamma subunit [Thiocapsa roseopersicina]
MNDFLFSSYVIWGVFPYVALTLFFVVPFIRMVYRPFGMSTRASGIFHGQGILGLAAHFLHWGIFLAFFGHLAGLIGGLLGWGSWVGAFFWMATLGGVFAIVGSVIALVRRTLIPEMRAMSQPDDYIVHLFLIAILGVAIYQALGHRIWGVSFTAAPWFASLWRLSPQPELMASAPLLSKIHILLAFAFAAYFPFTKLIHAWTLPVNYLVRPYQVLRTTAKKFQNGWVLGCWEFKGVTDKSYMTYLTAGVVGVLVLIAFVLPSPKGEGLVQTAYASTGATEDQEKGPDSSQAQDVLEGYPLYVSQCARCHGLEGHGDGPGAKSPTFTAVPRNLTEGHFQFISSSNGVASSDDLRHAVVHGLTGSGMPGFGALSDRQIDSLVQTVEQFWVDRPTPGEPIAVPARPEPTVAMIKEGKELYAGMCSVCHGPTGAGDGVLQALRTDAAGRPVPTRNLRTEPLKGGSSDEQIYYRIAAGLPRNKGEWLMPAYANLGPDKIWSLITYLETEVFPQTQVARR